MGRLEISSSGGEIGDYIISPTDRFHSVGLTAGTGEGSQGPQVTRKIYDYRSPETPQVTGGIGQLPNEPGTPSGGGIEEPDDNIRRLTRLRTNLVKARDTFYAKVPLAKTKSDIGRIYPRVGSILSEMIALDEKTDPDKSTEHLRETHTNTLLTSLYGHNPQLERMSDENKSRVIRDIIDLYATSDYYIKVNQERKRVINNQVTACRMYIEGRTLSEISDSITDFQWSPDVISEHIGFIVNIVYELEARKKIRPLTKYF